MASGHPSPADSPGAPPLEISLARRLGSMEDLGSFGVESNSSTEDLSLRGKISSPAAKMGNEFASADVAQRLQRGFRRDLHRARDAILRNTKLKQSAVVDESNAAGVWTAMAWLLYDFSHKITTRIPFTTIATALDLLRRSIRYTRLHLTFQPLFFVPGATELPPAPPELTELQQAVADAAYVHRMSQQERHIWLYAAFLLASKVEETIFPASRLKRFVSDEQLQRTFQKEQEILRILGFDIVLAVPHLQLIRLCDTSIYLQCPDYLQELALQILNISIFTAVQSVYHPVSIAVTAMYLAVQSKASLLPESDPLISRAWWDDFQVPFSDIIEISQQLVPAWNSLLDQEPPLETPLAAVASSPPPLPLNRRSINPCRHSSQFEKLQLISSGTFGRVWQARDTTTGQTVALKKLLNTMGHSGFPYYMLREILYLIRLQHPNIIHGIAMVAKEATAETSGVPGFYIVMEFLEWDLERLLSYQDRLEEQTTEIFRFSLGQAKDLLYQLLQAIAYMHSLHLLHRDLKTANLLLSSEGVLKVADLGSARDADRSLNMTTTVITLWYRPPELLCETPTYSTAVDIWSIGCVFFELVAYRALFRGENEVDTLCQIIEAKGAPPTEVWNRCYQGRAHFDDPAVVAALAAHPHRRHLQTLVPNLSPEGADLFARMLEWDPEARITALEALSHPFFSQRPPRLPAIPPPVPPDHTHNTASSLRTDAPDSSSSAERYSLL